VKKQKDVLPMKEKIGFIGLGLIGGSIATILANHQINIKNIGIIHNREFEEGALRIEFYEDRARIQAISCLRERQYLIFER
jgi:prephenate dehydrogenase